MAAQPNPTPVNPDAMMQFAFKVVGDLAAAMSGPLLYIGDKEGLFKTIAAHGRITVPQLAAATGLQERYQREWSSAMVASEYLEFDPATGELWLSPERAMVLANEDSPVFCMGMAQMIPDHYRVLPRVQRAFHEGGGVPYSEYSDDTIEGTERLFGPGYRNFMVQQWIPAMPEVERKLREGAKVADVGCGRGQALITMAKAYPKSQFLGFDNYAPAVEHANAAARREGLAGRLRFEVCASDALPQTHDFDLVMTCDSLH
ncbi:MAG: class I SAM-dependent methyltransferase, partial [Streptosporangiaceae bacterium]